MPYKISVDEELCIGAASCVALAPLAFQLNDAGKAVTLPTLGQVPDNQLLDAAKSCPVDAIIVTDEQGNQIWPEK